MKRWSRFLFVAFHYLWYLAVAPLMGSLVFFLISYILREKLPIGKAIVSAAISSVLGLLFFLVAGAVIASLVVPIVLFAGRRLVAGVHLITIPALAWFTIPWGDSSVSDQLALVLGVVAVVSTASVVLYWQAHSRLFSTVARSDDSDDLRRAPS